MNVLALLAAVVPIFGPLYAGALFLAEQSRLRSEERARWRVIPLVEHWKETVGPALISSARACGVALDVAGEAEVFRQRMLEAYGVPPDTYTWGHFDLDHTMSAPVVPLPEVRRQAVLLVSAVIGIMLIAADLAT